MCGPQHVETAEGGGCVNHERKVGEVCTSSAQCESVKGKCRRVRQLSEEKRCVCMPPAVANKGATVTFLTTKAMVKEINFSCLPLQVLVRIPMTGEVIL